MYCYIDFLHHIPMLIVICNVYMICCLHISSAYVVIVGVDPCALMHNIPIPSRFVFHVDHYLIFDSYMPCSSLLMSRVIVEYLSRFTHLAVQLRYVFFTYLLRYSYLHVSHSSYYRSLAFRYYQTPIDSFHPPCCMTEFLHWFSWF